MDNYFTLMYVVKVLIGVIIYYAVKKLVRKFLIRRIDTYDESKLLKYLFKNHSILDFDDNVDVFSSTKNKINIANSIYFIMISYDEVLHTYNYIVEDIYFNSNTKYSKMTKSEYSNIKQAITGLGLDKYRPE